MANNKHVQNFPIKNLAKKATWSIEKHIEDNISMNWDWLMVMSNGRFGTDVEPSDSAVRDENTLSGLQKDGTGSGSWPMAYFQYCWCCINGLFLHDEVSSALKITAASSVVTATAHAWNNDSSDADAGRSVNRCFRNDLNAEICFHLASILHGTVIKRRRANSFTVQSPCCLMRRRTPWQSLSQWEGYCSLSLISFPSFPAWSVPWNLLLFFALCYLFFSSLGETRTEWRNSKSCYPQTGLSCIHFHISDPEDGSNIFRRNLLPVSRSLLLILLFPWEKHTYRVEKFEKLLPSNRALTLHRLFLSDMWHRIAWYIEETSCIYYHDIFDPEDGSNIADLDDMEWKFFTLPGLELRPFCHPARRQPLHRLLFISMYIVKL
jgi:hypothetical protein